MKLDKIKLILSMTIFGTIGLVRKYIPYPSSVLALVRAITGMFFLLTIFWYKKESFKKDKLIKNIIPLIGSGIALGANWICLFEAYRFTSVSVATVCYYMAPVIVIALSPVIFREKITLKKGFCALLALLGMILVSGIFETDILGLKGILFGLAAAMLYASVIIFNKFIDDLSANERTLLQLGISAISLLPYVLFTENLAALEINGTILGMLVIAGVVHTGIAYALYFGSIRNIPAQTVALYSYIDPILAVLISVFILKENMSAMAMAGAVLVIGAMLVSERE